MAKTPSTMLDLGTLAPDFHLPDTRGRLVSRDDFSAAPALLVMFLCNHCPFVKHIRQGLATFAREYQKKGLAIVAINANDVARYPDDSPAKMAEEAVLAGYTFPYLYGDSSIAASSTTAARRTVFSSPAPIFALPATPRSPGSRSPLISGRASAATSSG